MVFIRSSALYYRPQIYYWPCRPRIACLTRAWGRLKPSKTRLFFQLIVHATNKENIAAPHHWPFMRGTTDGFPVQMASNTESVWIPKVKHVAISCSAFELWWMFSNRIFRFTIIQINQTERWNHIEPYHIMHIWRNRANNKTLHHAVPVIR